MVYLNKLLRKWKKIAHKIGVFQSKVILTLIFFTLALPFGIIFALFKDYLGMRKNHQSTWKDKGKQSSTMKDLELQS